MSEARYDCPDQCDCDPICELNIYDDSWPSVEDLFSKEWKYVLAAASVVLMVTLFGVASLITWVSKTGLTSKVNICQ